MRRRPGDNPLRCLPYTTLETDAASASTLAAQIQHTLTADFVAAFTSTLGPLLPAAVIVDVRYAAIDSCPTGDPQ